MKLHADPGPARETIRQPTAVLDLRTGRGQPQDEAPIEARLQVRPLQPVAALGTAPARPRDQMRQISVPLAICRQHHQPHPIHEPQLTADNQVQAAGLGLAMGSHNPRQGALIGQGECPVAQLPGPAHQFLRVRGRRQEGVVGAAVQLCKARKRILHHDAPENCSFIQYSSAYERVWNQHVQKRRQ